MSYLLKALEKAEQERQQTVLTEHDEPIVVQQKSTLPVSLVIGVVTILLLTLWQAWPNNHQTSDNDTLHVDSKSQAREEPASEIVQLKATNEPQTIASSAQNASINEPDASIVIEPKAKDLSELTAQELAQIPSLNLASHIYSSAADYRSVVINNQTYKEGALIKAGLKLEEINQSGIIININGQKVELPKGISWVASQNAK